MLRSLRHLILLSLVLTGTAFADMVSIQLNHVFNGSGPTGSPPWLTATFDDSPSSAVLLTLQANLVDTQFITEWDFNINPELGSQLTGLTAEWQSGKMAASFGAAVDHFKADGDGWYDLGFVFPQAARDRFAGMTTSVYLLSIPGVELHASDFAFYSSPGGGAGTYQSAAHIQNTVGGGAWIGDGVYREYSTPEPGTWQFIAIGIGLLAAGSRRLRT